jgi:exopolysaccharide biosynthesis predicted pyruvyltransferase EpsI
LTSLPNPSWSEMPIVAKEKYDLAFKGVSEVTILDVPDYANVGDSAIFLGLLEYFRMSNIKVLSAFSRGTLSHKLEQHKNFVFIGGGSFGGLSPETDEQRVFLLQNLKANQRVIQCPQSIEYTSQAIQDELSEVMSDNPQFLIMARDEPSFEKISKWRSEKILAPDAIHFLPVEKSVRIPGKISYLIRTDKESTSSSTNTVDKRWLRDEPRELFERRIRLLGRFSEPLANFLNPGVLTWEKIARRRFSRGIKILGDAEVVVTNRLHGMLMGLNLKKKVVYFDNSNRKLSAYATTWLKNCDSLIQAENLAQAKKIAVNLTGNL